MKLRLRYGCFFDARPGGRMHYEYFVRDLERGQDFAIVFEVTELEMSEGTMNPRRRWAMYCEEKLWMGIKVASPGTYLDARALGWTPGALLVS